MNGYAWTVLTFLAGLLAVQTWYYVERVWDLNRRHQRHLDDLREEYRMQDIMLRNLTLPAMEGSAALTVQQSLGAVKPSPVVMPGRAADTTGGHA